MDSKLYFKIIAGEATEKEKEIFYLTIKSNPNEENEFIKMKNLWNLQEIGKGIDSGLDKQRLFNKFWEKANTKSGTRIRQFTTTWMKYAAIFVIALATGFLVEKLVGTNTETSTKEFYSESGSISNVVLEDGSKITLNANTHLVIHESKNNVLAELKGEGYFDIVHNEKREFVVETGDLKIKDLGTVFNISAYPDNSIIRATLLDGEIDVLNHSGTFMKKLSPSQTFKYNQLDKTYSLEVLDSSLVVGWKDNKFVFIDKSLSEICKEIERWYGVNISIEDHELAGEIYTSVIKRTTTVSQVMEMFALTSGIKYQINENQNEKAIIYINK